MLRVQKDVAPPISRKSDGFPFRIMEIGDSFIVPAKRKASAYGRAYQFKRSHPGWDYMSQTLPDGTCRFWRTT